ncbi:predicted protein [Sclerotinia sclerotiorum 1980 UF-70]|uniref:Uncharacterized protein n=1 Tax=Sclerotinia sclerotiorum (strain ATCC 18683 / 1980 / Ss-1) TaxID=665079 RepID=A7F7M2_SCLS1|nr:predicted protein [Sclerotinia sclerotiorum 1980 UF-70]EDN98743.1 predicted protein [Sclerotinia sclerotiorum 1980 UF-70]
MIVNPGRLIHFHTHKCTEMNGFGEIDKCMINMDDLSGSEEQTLDSNEHGESDND